MAVHEANPDESNDLGDSCIHLELGTRVKPFVVGLEDVGGLSLVISAMSVAASETAPEEMQQNRLSMREHNFNNHCFDYHSTEVGVPQRSDLLILTLQEPIRIRYDIKLLIQGNEHIKQTQVEEL